MNLDRIYERLKKANQQMIQAFGMTVEKKDPYTAGHQFRVSKLSEAIARENEIRGTIVESIKLSALIHDIGKIGISPRFANKKTKIKQRRVQRNSTAC